MTVFSGGAIAQDTDGVTTLDPLLLKRNLDQAAAVLNGESDQDTGTTILGEATTKTRSSDSGDATTALYTLPTVQYLNNSEDATDQGENADNVLDMRPADVSISGQAVTENNFMINGLSMNSYVAMDPQTHDDPDDLTRISSNFGASRVRAFYGLGSQSQYVPSSLVESVEVMASNVSARHGNFQGGVVDYKLAKPDLNRKGWYGSFSTNYQNDSMVSYHIGTEDGDNPYDRDKPEWEKTEFAFSLGKDLDERTAAYFAYSRRTVTTEKQMDATYHVTPEAEYVDSKSVSNFYRFGIARAFDNGELTFTTDITDYDNGWRSDAIYDLELAVKNLTIQPTLEYKGKLDVFGGVDVQAKAFYTNTSMENAGGTDDDYEFWRATRVRERDFDGDGTEEQIVYESTVTADWCAAPDGYDPDEDGSMLCYRGDLGDKTLDDETVGAEFSLEKEISNGKFTFGGSIQTTEAHRTFSGLTYYSTVETLADAQYTLSRNNGALTALPYTEFTCPAGDEHCTAEQFSRYYQVYNAFDNVVTTTKADVWLEFEQEWETFSYRAGLRVDWNDYLDNVDIAPRLSATWKPQENLSFTLGANRYYSGRYIAYAIHDNAGSWTTYKRGYDLDTGVVDSDWTTVSSTGVYNYSDGNLRTPYNDELTLAVNWTDPWTSGDWRLTLEHREAKDQFAQDQSSTTRNKILSNDGFGEYNSLTLEYAHSWEVDSSAALDNVGFHAAAVYAERSMSNDTYFEDVILDEYKWYNGTTYSDAGFEVVTGNLDIPWRMTFGVNTNWLGGKLRLGVSGDVVFGYWGVEGTGDDADDVGIVAMYNGVDVSGDTEVYEDKLFNTALSLNLSIGYTIAEIAGNPLDIEVKVNNLFDNTGSRTANNSNPWLRGRSISFGTEYTW